MSVPTQISTEAHLMSSGNPHRTEPGWGPPMRGWTPMAEGKPRRPGDMVVKHLRDGRRRSDAQAKRELIEACLQPVTNWALASTRDQCQPAAEVDRPTPAWNWSGAIGTSGCGEGAGGLHSGRRIGGGGADRVPAACDVAQRGWKPTLAWRPAPDSATVPASRPPLRTHVRHHPALRSPAAATVPPLDP